MIANHLYFQGYVELPHSRRRSAVLRTVSGSTAPPLAEADVFFEELFESAGLAASAYRNTALRRRIPACLRFLKVRDLEAGRLKIQEKPELIPELLEVVLLGVTAFYRDPQVFEHLHKEVIPQWMLLNRPVRVWSAACSDGRELYSIASLLDQGGVAVSELLGTDCRREAIERAQSGEFPADALNCTHGEWTRDFVSHRSRVCVSERLKTRLRWKQANLLKETEPGPWDMILWRNMAIYLNPGAAEPVWRSLLRQLPPGGWLVTGKADNPPKHPELLKISACLYRKKSPL